MISKHQFEAFRGRFPLIGDFAFRVFHGGLLRRKRNHVKGQNNVFRVHRSAVLDGVIFDVKGNNNFIEIERDCILRNVKIFLRGEDHSIFLAAGVRFHRGGVLWMEDSQGTISVKAKTTFEDAHLAVTGIEQSITIGSDCMIANDVDIRTGDSHALLDKKGKKINREASVCIGDHVWIASHCSILKGAFVANDCVVGTRSVVNRKFNASGCVLAGSPAEIRRQGVSWARERFEPFNVSRSSKQLSDNSSSGIN